jgi:hypothetical protein
MRIPSAWIIAISFSGTGHAMVSGQAGYRIAREEMEEMIRLALSLAALILSTYGTAYAVPSPGPAPEPGSLTLIGLGLAGAVALRRRRR